VNVNLPGTDDYVNTFTADTRPTAEQAQPIIDHAVADVVLAIPVAISVALEPAAKNAAMWRAAADIELAYPERNADANYYRDLNERALYEWGLFKEAADQEGSGTESHSPNWAFPEPVWYGDRTDI
jgi:hypothetical protein